MMNYDKIGIDSEDLFWEMSKQSRISELGVIVKGELRNYVLVKSPMSQMPEEEHHRIPIKTVRLFSGLDDIQPSQYIQYTVLTEECANQMLMDAHNLQPLISINVPAYPKKLDEIDQYNIEMAHQFLLNPHQNITLYYHPLKRHFITPSRDPLIPELEDVLNACEIVHQAHGWSRSFDLFDLNTSFKYHFDTTQKTFVQYIPSNSLQYNEGEKIDYTPIYVTDSHVNFDFNKRQN